MNEGRILKEGSPRRLVEDEIGREVVEIRVAKEEDGRLVALAADCCRGHERAGDTLYFHCDSGHELVKKIVDLGLPDVRNRPATLEDVFLKLTGRSLAE
jgi:lipooligosaccharide transport system ATP-binding protein